MKDLDANDLLTRAASGKLTRAEQRSLEELLQREPKLRRTLDEEKALDGLLDAVPNVPVSSNFTSLVLQACRREDAGGERVRRAAFPWFRTAASRVTAALGGAAVAGLIIGASMLRQADARRGELAQSVRSFTEVASVIGAGSTPAAQLFQDFDSIQRLSVPERADSDLELLLALQK